MKIKAAVAALLLVPIVGVCDPLPTCPGAVVIASQTPAPGVVRGHGTDTVEFCLAANGSLIREPRIVQSSGNREFDDAALATVAGGHYTRLTADGKACCTTMKITGPIPGIQ